MNAPTGTANWFSVATKLGLGDKLVQWYIQAFQARFRNATERFVVRLWDGQSFQFGDGPPEFTLHVRTPSVLFHLHEDGLAAAFYRGDWGIEGDIGQAFGLRKYVPLRSPLRGKLELLARIWFLPSATNNKQAIDHHYTLGDDFYLSFLDTGYRIYSHGHFRHPDESLEAAEEHKVEDMYAELNLQPGLRLLDIGGGWGAVPQYCGARGVQVTSLTLAADSQRFIQGIIDERKLPCKVLLEDFLKHRPAEPYDAIVIFGVIEHIPQYRRFVEQVWRVLKPGGLMYLDASSTRVKYDMSDILKKTIWPTTTAYLSVHDLIAEINYGALDLLSFRDESEDYKITMRHWAERFDKNREAICARWGEETFRIFQLYLWGGFHCFKRGTLQACRMLIRRPHQRAEPPPSTLRRLINPLLGPY